MTHSPVSFDKIRAALFATREASATTSTDDDAIALFDVYEELNDAEIAILNLALSDCSAAEPGCYRADNGKIYIRVSADTPRTPIQEALRELEDIRKNIIAYNPNERSITNDILESAIPADQLPAIAEHARQRGL